MRKSIRNCFQDFSESARPISQLMKSIQGQAPGALKDKYLRAQHGTIQLGSVVLLSGYLESYLKAICEAYFAELLTKGFGAKKLGDRVVETHLREGAGHLTDLVKRESKKSPGSLTESEAFVRRLVAPILDANKAPVWEAFARTQGNPSPRVVKDVLKGLGISDPFQRASVAVNGRYSSATFDQLLQNFVDLRNECAHTGTAQVVPSPSTIYDFVMLLRTLTLGIAKIVDLRVTEIIDAV